MIYINKLTRATIDSPTPIFGGDWVLIDQEEKEEHIAETKTQPKISDELENAENNKSVLTKADIMEELDAFGIEYDKKATKAELYEIMMNRK